jgi:hypothetical protein
MAFTSMTAHISITKVSRLYDLVFFSKKDYCRKPQQLKLRIGIP